MKSPIRLACLSSLLLTLAHTAPAGAVAEITAVSADGSGLGSFELFVIDQTDRRLEFNKVFDHFGPIILTFKVEHGDGTGGSYSVLEDIANNTGQTWRDFRFDLVEPGDGYGVTFDTQISPSLTGLILHSSGPQTLRFVGDLSNGGVPAAVYGLSLPDPDVGYSYTFQLIQTPAIPEPGAWAMIVTGLLAVASLVTRASSNHL